MIAARPVLLAALAVAWGCGGSAQPDDAAPPPAAHDCLAAWNGAGNEENRDRIAEEGFQVARVGEFVQIAEFADGVPEEQRATGRKEGCSYLFHTDRRYVSMSATWAGERLRWGMLPALSGSWTGGQEANVDDNARVLSDGALAELAPGIRR